MRTALAALLSVAAGLIVTSGSVSAQHENVDIEEGGRTFRSACANCHGTTGDQIAGIDLGRGRFRRVYSDPELVGIIRNGIPNTPMAATGVTEQQAINIVGYLRSLAGSTRGTAAIAGDLARGQSIYEGKGACATCHRVNGVGSRLGPDLSAIGRDRISAELEQSLINPGAEVLATNRFYRVVTKDGVSVMGRLLNHDTFTVQMLDAKEQLRSFVKADMREHGFVGTPMPSYFGTLDPQERADVISYLMSLKGASQ
jgi:putative heme-binding domain-containing protein